MGIEIRWEDERGNQLDVLPDSGHLVGRFLPGFDAKDFPCLRFVDPVGDAVFNQMQIGELVWELERLLSKRQDPRVEHHLRALLDLVRRANGKTHTYIKFYGD